MGLQGERQDSAMISERGVAGDRQFALVDVLTGKVIDPVRYGYGWGETKPDPAILEIKARYSKDSSTSLELLLPENDRIASSIREIEQKASSFLRREVKLVPSPEIMDEKLKTGRALHVLTNASLNKMKQFYPEGDFDVRRFRPNILVEVQGPPDFVEEKWTGRTILVGLTVELTVEQPNKRCAVTTMKQGSLKSDPRILETISLVNRSMLGVMCAVSVPGGVRVGDEVLLLD
jgi:uncharacterized protein YcbX